MKPKDKASMSIKSAKEDSECDFISATHFSDAIYKCTVCHANFTRAINKKKTHEYPH